MMRVGLIGVGVISRYYAGALAEDPRAVLQAVCDLDADRLRGFAAAGVACTTRIEDVVADPAVDALIVTLPNDLHHEVCAAGLRAGKHVLCEKPLALRAADARALAALAAAERRTLFTAFHRRYNRNVLALHQRVRDRGPLRSLRVRYFEDIREHCGADSWYLDARRCGGGVIADNGPNALDLVHLFLGPVEIERSAVVRDSDGIDRQAEIACRSRDGSATATILLDWSYGSGELKDLAVTCAGGSPDGADMLAGFPAFKSSLQHEYVAVLDDFLRHVDLGSPESPRGPDGVAVARLVERALDMEPT